MQGAAPKKRSKLRRVFKWLTLAFFAFIVLVIGAVVGIRLYYTDARLTALVRTQLKKYVPLDVGIGLVELRLLHGIVIKDLRVGPPTPDYKENVLTLSELRVGYRLWPLLDKKIAVDEVSLDIPTVVLEMQNGKWNVLAVADKFASDTPAEEPASQPEEDTGDIGVEINLKAAAIDELSARVISPDIKAALNHVSLRATGRYTGAEASAQAELHFGDDTHGPSKVRADLTGTGAATLDLRWDVFADAASLSAASVKTKLVASAMKGTMAGFALPPQTLTLDLQADASLLTQRAVVSKLTLALGKALAITLKASAADVLGDVDLTVTQADIDADLGDVLRLLPSGMVPVTATGLAELRDVALHARLSELTALTPFDAKLALRLTDVSVIHEAARLAGVQGTLVANLGREGSLGADLGLSVAELVAGGASDGLTVNGVELTLNAKGPASLLRGKLSSLLTAKLALGAESIALQEPSLVVSKTAIELDAKLQDLAAERADATLGVTVGNVRFESESLGVLNAPATLQLVASRRAPVITIDKLALAVSDVIGIGLNGSVNMKPKGVFDLALDLLVKDIDTQKAIALAPTKLKEQLAAYDAKGSVGLSATVKGPVTADIGKHFAQETFELLDAGTPFDLQLGLNWKGLGAKIGDMRLSGSDGSIGVVTKPKQLKAAIEIGLGKFTMEGGTPVTLDDTSFTLDASYEKGEALGAGNLRLGRAAVPTQLTMPLADSSLDYELSFARGGEVAINRIALSLPTLGGNVVLRGRLAKPERVVATKAWSLPTWKGLQADASLSVDVDLPSGTKLLPGNELTLGGGAGLDVDASIAEGLVKISGAIKATKLNVLLGDLNVKNLNGSLPFKQDLKKVASDEGLGLRLVLSNKDILTEKPRVAYYSDLRSYGRDDDSLKIERFTQGRTDISRIALNGRLEDGKLLVDHFALQALTGDLEGQLALQVSPDEALRATVGAKFSNIDLSVLSKTPPGPDSQINGNLLLNLQWSRKLREIDASTVNLTRMGGKMISALLLALDPERKDESKQGVREKIERFGFQLNILRLSVNHNLLTPELDAEVGFLDKIAKLFGQRVLNLKPDRTDLKPYLNQYLVPVLDPVLQGSFARDWLGWRVEGVSK